VRALCDFAVKVTAEPSKVGAAEVETLRAAGCSDAAIHDALQVIAYFNYGSLSGSGRDQARSKRSRLITLSQAATKSRTKISFASSHA
jgi:hypothetical protein